MGKNPAKIVCVCSEQQCDQLTFEWPSRSGQALVVDTTRSGHRFRVRELVDSPSQPKLSDNDPALVLVLADKKQEILGWGGSFTDAAAINIQSLSDSMSERLLESYFGPNGLQYNFGRVPIGGSDFSTRPYSYDDSPEPDFNLTHWALAREDLEHKIPVIKRAKALVAADEGKQELKLFATPWSPPKWMKTSNDFRRGHLIDTNENLSSYARYLVKFYQAYREHGIEFWGATVQNEPMSAYLPMYFFNSLQMSGHETIKFVAEYLGPQLESSLNFTKQNFKLMIGDDSLGFINYQVPSIMEDKRVQRYISGLAFHWYLSGLLVPYEALTNVMAKIKDKIEFVMMSEACQGAFLSSKHVDLGDWHRGESYASDIIEDLKRGTGAWIDWNMALDLEGGPNWAKNFVDSPIIVDKSRNEFMKQPMYYVLAQFTRFLKPRSMVVDSRWSGPAGRWRGLSVVAAHVQETDHIVATILNKSNMGREFSLAVVATASSTDNSSVTRIAIEPTSVSTVVIKL